MSRWTLSLIPVVLLLPGCVYVTQPLSDPEKAEPDKRLLGRWEGADGERCEIEILVVKGNPKGLMHCRGANHDFWFFTTTIGEQTYWTVYLDTEKLSALGKNEGGIEKCFADFSQDGAFEKWKNGNDRLYTIDHYVLKDDRLTVHHWGEGIERAMKAELIPAVNDGNISYFKTPPGWLAKYLEKNGPEPLYNGGQSETLERPEKRKAAEEKRRADGEAANKAARKIAEQEKKKAEQQKDEKWAAALLSYAKRRADAGKVEDAKERFRHILERLPNTEAAKEAQLLLDKLGK